MAKAKAKAHLRALAKGDGKSALARKFARALRSRVRGFDKDKTHQAFNESDNRIMRLLSTLKPGTVCRGNCGKGKYFLSFINQGQLL